MTTKVPKLSSSDGVIEMNGGGGQVTGKPNILKAPFPYAGGKSKVADYVWSRLGDVDNYCEPFAGSLAVLLRRPAEHFANGYRVETVNDVNHYLVNFWRAVREAPDAVAEHADWPVTEADLHARHRWLVKSDYAEGWRNRMATDPEHYDAKIAGWWCWGACCWIGSGWCEDRRSPALSMQVPDFDGGRGEYTASAVMGRPQLTDAFDIGRGVNGGAAYCTSDEAKRPVFPDRCLSRGVTNQRREWLTDWMRRLSDRLRLVRTCYGHWSRICDSDSTLTRLGTTGVFLDPPYPVKTEKGTRATGLYTNDAMQDLDALRDEVLAWCRKWGASDGIRIAVCGYEGDGYEALIAEGWGEHSWEAGGGYGNQKKGRGKADNAKRERIWFSPACDAVTETPSLFAGAA